MSKILALVLSVVAVSSLSLHSDQASAQNVVGQNVVGQENFVGLSSSQLLLPRVPYHTLAGRNLYIRYPEGYEAQARTILSKLDVYLDKLQADTKVPIRHPLNLFLTSKFYGNAYFTSSGVGDPNHVILPSELIGATVNSDFTYRGGFEETPYDVAVHELTHHYQGEIGRPWLERLFGASFETDQIILPPWFWEGWAVHRESQGQSYKGRMKPSYFGALLRSGLNGRDAVSDDFSSSSLEFLFDGVHYLLGANFMDFLARKYGEDALNNFVVHATEFHAESDFKYAFHKTFRQLLAEFNAEIKSLPVDKNTTDKTKLWADHSRAIDGLVRFPDGSLSFVAAYLNNEPQLIHIDKDGKEISRHNWRHVLAGIAAPQPSVPFEAHAMADNKTVYALVTTASQDKQEALTQLYSYNVDTDSREHLLTVPSARSLAVDPLGKHLWVARESDQPGTMEIQEWDLINKTAKPPVVLKDIESISRLELSPDGTELSFSAARRGRGWDLAAWNTQSHALRILSEEPGQEMFPHWSADSKRVYFLSDQSKKFQVHSVSIDGGKNQICQITQPQWLTQDFVVDNSGTVISADRYAKDYDIVAHTSLNHCVAAVAPMKVGDDPAPFAGPVIDESPWSFFIPQTRAIYPSFEKGAHMHYGFVLGGESPYKGLAWNGMASFYQKAPKNYRAGVQVASVDLGNVRSTISIVSAKDLIGQGDLNRYLQQQVRFSLPLWNHTLSFEALNYNRTSGPNEINEVAGFGASHSFSTTVSTAGGYSTKRGISLTTAYEIYPDSMSSFEKTVGVFNATQTVYLPWLIRGQDTFFVSAQEVMTKNFGAIAAGGKNDWDFSSNFALDDVAAFAPLANPFIAIPLYGQTDFEAAKIFVFRAGYIIPLRFLETGATQVADRTWWSTTLRNFRLIPFVNALTSPSLDGASDNIDTSKPWHAVAGVTGAFDISIFDSMPFLSNSASVIRHLSDSKDWDFLWTVNASITF